MFCRHDCHAINIHHLCENTAFSYFPFLLHSQQLRSTMLSSGDGKFYKCIIYKALFTKISFTILTYISWLCSRKQDCLLYSFRLGKIYWGTLKIWIRPSRVRCVLTWSPRTWYLSCPYCSIWIGGKETIRHHVPCTFIVKICFSFFTDGCFASTIIIIYGKWNKAVHLGERHYAFGQKLCRE